MVVAAVAVAAGKSVEPPGQTDHLRDFISRVVAREASVASYCLLCLASVRIFFPYREVLWISFRATVPPFLLLLLISSSLN